MTPRFTQEGIPEPRQHRKTDRYEEHLEAPPPEMLRLRTEAAAARHASIVEKVWETLEGR